MATKYSLSRREQWRLRGDDRPRISDHILGGPDEDGPGRWDERTPAGSVAPETAWVEGVPLEEAVLSWFDGERLGRPDRARLFAEREPGYVAIIICQDTPQPVATTVFTLEQVHRPERKAYLTELAERRVLDD